jgi:hypothetical protein
MSALTIDVVQHQRTTEFRLFGPHVLIRNGEPVEVPLGGPRELLALLLLNPNREATFAQISSAMGRRVRMKEAEKFFDELIAALAGTDIEPSLFNSNMRRRTSDWNRRSLAYAGLSLEGPIDVDLDRFAALAHEALALTSTTASIDLLRRAAHEVGGVPLHGLTGTYFEQRRQHLIVARAAAHKLTAGLETFGEPGSGVLSKREILRAALVMLDRDIYGHAAARGYADTPDDRAGSNEPSAGLILPVSIFLGDGRDHELIEAALTQYLTGQGLEVFGHQPPVIGSWFRRFWARTKKETAHLTPARLGAEAERKVRIEVFDKDQAAIDNLVATGMAALVTSLQGETNACVRAGAILVLKVDGRLYSTTLFQYQLAWLERNQVLLQDPEGLLKGLDSLGTRQPQDAIEQPSNAARVTFDLAVRPARGDSSAARIQPPIFAGAQLRSQSGATWARRSRYRYSPSTVSLRLPGSRTRESWP